MNILICGAAGKISRLLIDRLLNNNMNLVLYARNANHRLSSYKNHDNIKIIDGDFSNVDQLNLAMQKIDFVYLNDNQHVSNTLNIINTMKKNNVNRILVSSVMDVYGEVKGVFGLMSKGIVGDKAIKEQSESVKAIENSGLDYTILRLAWLTDNEEHPFYITHKGEDFKGQKISRKSVVKFIEEIINDNSSKYIGQSLGLGNK